MVGSSPTIDIIERTILCLIRMICCFNGCCLVLSLLYCLHKGDKMLLDLYVLVCIVVGALCIGRGIGILIIKVIDSLK